MAMDGVAGNWDEQCQAMFVTNLGAGEESAAALCRLQEVCYEAKIAAVKRSRTAAQLESMATLGVSRADLVLHSDGTLLQAL